MLILELPFIHMWHEWCGERLIQTCISCSLFFCVLLRKKWRNSKTLLKNLEIPSSFCQDFSSPPLCKLHQERFFLFVLKLKLSHYQEGFQSERVSRIPEKVEAKVLRLLSESAVDSGRLAQNLRGTQHWKLWKINQRFFTLCSPCATGRVVSQRKVSTSSWKFSCSKIYLFSLSPSILNTFLALLRKLM